MSQPNSVWKDTIEQITQVSFIYPIFVSFIQYLAVRSFKNQNVLMDAEVLRSLVHILKTNVAACKSIGAPFYSQVKSCEQVSIMVV